MKATGAFVLSIAIGLAAGPALASEPQRSAADSMSAMTRGMEEMQRFMTSERMPQAMSAMMAMAERMGGGDPMLGMVRMMEMMSMMGGGMMGGSMMDAPMRPEPPRQERQ